MSHIGPPIGDPIYSGRSRFPKGISDALKKAISQLKRQALHAISLELSHLFQEGYSLHIKAPQAVASTFRFLSHESNRLAFLT